VTAPSLCRAGNIIKSARVVVIGSRIDCVGSVKAVRGWCADLLTRTDLTRIPYGTHGLVDKALVRSRERRHGRRRIKGAAKQLEL
jgi:hypothetical protein